MSYRISFLCIVFLTVFAANANACFVCMGDPDSPMSVGLRMGIITLLVFLIFVLAAFARFFWILRNRAIKINREDL